MPGEDWQFFLNCPDHAFRTATATLERRIAQFGLESEEVKAWSEAQDIVFSNCQGGENIPPEAGPHLDPLVRADRAYQIAAAHFYAGHFEEAAARFQTIAWDSGSAWRQWGTYLAARSWIRKATLETQRDHIDDESFAKALKLLDAVLDDPEKSEQHPSAQGLKALVSARTHPAERLKELANLLLQPDPRTSMKQLWSDYHFLLDRGYGRGQQDDLTDWLRSFPLSGDAALDHALARWKRSGGLQWVVAVLINIESDHPDLNEVLKAAAAVPETAPGHLTVSFYRFLLLSDLGRSQQLRDELDKVLAMKLPPVSRNQFLAFRMRLARSLDEFLRLAPRSPTPDWRSSGEPGFDVLLDRDSRAVFNTRLPLVMLEQAAQSERLSGPIRMEIALAAWARAGMIDDLQSWRRLTGVLKDQWPALAADLDPVMEAADPNERKRAFVYLLLRRPGIRPVVRGSTIRAEPLVRINHSRDSWWCRMDGELVGDDSGWRYANRREYLRDHGNRADLDPVFLSDNDKAEAAREVGELSGIETGPNYLSTRAIQWAKEAPDDPRVPEALHLAVRTTRYGCVDDDTSGFSKAAFQLLHRRYPNSEWAKKTKYWY